MNVNSRNKREKEKRKRKKSRKERKRRRENKRNKEVLLAYRDIEVILPYKSLIKRLAADFEVTSSS